MDANHRPPAGQPARIPRLRGSSYYLLHQRGGADGRQLREEVYRSQAVALADAAGIRAEGFHTYIEPVDRERARDLLQHGAGWDPTTVSALTRKVPGGVDRRLVRAVLAAIAVDARNGARLTAGVTLREMGAPTMGDAWRVNLRAARALAGDVPEVGGVDMSAARHLQYMGAHFVLLAEGKRPAWRGWNQRRPPLRLVEEHAAAGLVGIIPASVRAVVVDVDHGTPETVTAATGAPWAVLGTRRGVHLWYDPPAAPVSRSTWTMGSTSGDLIGTGYVKLHGSGLEVLAGAIEYRVPAPLQLHLFTGTTTPGRGKSTTGGKAVEPSTFLEEVQPGARWDSLFEAVRFWAYAQHPGDCLDAWVKRCQKWARLQRHRFPNPTGFPEAEAARCGKKVAVWTWEHREVCTHTYDHSPEAQRRVAVKRWHGNARPWTLEQLDERNRAIVKAVTGGRSYRAVALAFGLSRSQVARIVRG